MLHRVGPENRKGGTGNTEKYHSLSHAKTWHSLGRVSGAHVTSAPDYSTQHFTAPTGFQKRHLMRRMNGNDTLPVLSGKKKKKDSPKTSKIIPQRLLHEKAVISD